MNKGGSFMKGKTMRKLQILLAAILALAMISGCGGKEATSESAKTDKVSVKITQEAEKKAEVKTEEVKQAASITLMASQNWIKDVDRTLFKKFEDETGIEVKVLLTPDNGYASLLGTTLAGGSDVVDIFMYSAGVEMVSVGVPDIALSLSDEAWTSNLEAWALEANTYKDHLYGFSTWGIDYEGILYNRSYFEENNLEVPKTWSDFMALLDEIKGLGKTPLYEGINGVWHTQSWLYGMTPALLKKDPNFIQTLNTGADHKLADVAGLKDGLKELEQLFAAKENGQPKYYTNDGQSEDWFGSYPALKDRDVVMMFTYSAYVNELKEQGSTDEWGMFPVPVLDNTQAISNGGGVSKYINKNSSKIEESKLLFQFLAEDENLELFYGERSDLITASFKEVESVKPTTATKEMIERSGGTAAPVMMIKEILYWDQDIYKYFQKMAEGTIDMDGFISGMDEFRSTMFEAAQ